MEIKITINDKLIQVLKKVFTKKNSIFFIALLLFCGGLLLFTQVPEIEIFQVGEVIYAEPINDNFRALRDRDLGSLKGVRTDGAVSGDALVYNGVRWIPRPLGIGCLWTENSGDDIFYNIGNVGIGTTEPGNKLEVAANNDRVLRLVDKAIDINGISGIEFFGHTYSGYDTDLAYIQSVHTNMTTTAGDLEFWTRDDNVILGIQKQMIIKGSGNVGIGTTGPAEKLEVNGNIKVNGGKVTLADGCSITGNGRAGHTLSTPDGYIQFGPLNNAYAHIYSDKTFYFNQGIEVQGDIYCTGKLTSVGGNDPPYVLYNKETKNSVIERIDYEVPDYEDHKWDGQAIFYDYEKGNMFLINPKTGATREFVWKENFEELEAKYNELEERLALLEAMIK